MPVRFGRASAGAWIGALALALSVGGCAKIKKTRDCKAFITKLNASLQEIEKQNSVKHADTAEAAEKIAQLSKLYERLAEDVHRMQISTPGLQTHASAYQEMAAKAADISARLAATAKGGDLQKALEIQKEFDGVIKREAELVSAINGFCSSP